MYGDIFLRSLLSFLLTAPLMFLFLLLVFILRARVFKKNDISGSVFLLFPFSVFHLYIFQFVSSIVWKYTPGFIYTLFSITFTIAFLHSLRPHREENRDGEICGKKESGNCTTTVLSFMRHGISGWFRAAGHALSHPVKMGGLVFFPLTWLLLAMQVILLIKFSAFTFQHPLLLPVSIAASLLMPVLLVQSLRAITSRISLLGTLLLSIIIPIYYLLTLYHITEETPFDYSILHLNSDLLSSGQTWVLLLEKFRLQSYVLTAFLAGFLFLVMVFRKKRNPESDTFPVATGNGIYSTVFYLLLFVLPIRSMDQLKNLSLSVKNFMDQESSLEAASALLENPYPYYRQPDSTGMSADPDTLPNIFLVCLESCNGMLIEQRTEDGREITPVFNSLIPKGVYIEHFYGNSVQTARGFFSILSGTPPSYRKKIATSFPDLSFVTIPSVMKQCGYTTLFLKAYHDLGYDNTGEFMKKAGFDHVGSMTEDILTDEEKNMRWGWGLQDDYFYRKCFRIIDSLYSHRPDSTKQRPFFVTTFNVSNHMMFQDIPAEQKYLYTDAGPADFKQNYRNSMFVSDSCLSEIITQIGQRTWLSNSVIIIVGDHGFPAGEHSIRNEKGAWEENFRTPFLLLWKGHVHPRRISGEACSQIDIFPTLLDLLDIATPHHAIGKSIFSKGHREPVMLAQPYDGISLVSIDYPYKYVKKFSGNANLLFDLSADPKERNNLYGRKHLESTVRKLQESTAQLMMNQVLIEQNRLMPKSQ
jgi:arylsulfatase A-like enzyme